MYKFRRASDVIAGPREMATLEGIERAQLLVAAREAFGDDVDSPEEFCIVRANAIDDDPDLVTCEQWDVYTDGSDKPTHMLLFFAWCDGGELFHAGSVDMAGLRLWPDGFKTSRHNPDPLDLAQLTAAWAAREG